ncbi:MAG: class I SAM-dependent methyltransferase [Acidobacteriota bacterium]|nr:class I SAM-dependent methyltransferase [Acidobacteriota bacterium]
MPQISENLLVWNQNYTWSREGDEWSGPWGGVEPNWFGTIYPRIHSFIPATTILEIAPGFGRWTQFLKDYCEHLVVVDLSQRCIEHCKDRFSTSSNITYHINDGKSLEMVEDESIDFAFSYDSLVHVEADVIEAYLAQLSKKLKPNGVGFIHHSNFGEYPYLLHLINRIPHKMRLSATDKSTDHPALSLIRKAFPFEDHWRAYSVTASLFERVCRQVGLQCFSQELINWRGLLLTDSFSLFTRRDSVWARSNKVIRNRGFMREAKYISHLSRLYAASQLRDGGRKD